MIECKDLAGKVVRSLTLFEEGSYRRLHAQ
jgi:hypothetical protein